MIIEAIRRQTMLTAMTRRPSSCPPFDILGIHLRFAILFIFFMCAVFYYFSKMKSVKVDNDKVSFNLYVISMSGTQRIR